MKPERIFIADRCAAQHCAELLRPAAPARSAPDPAADLARTLPHLEVAFARRLAPLAGGDAPRIACEPVSEQTHADFAASLPALSGICVLGAGAHATPMLAVIDAEAVFAQVDRAFGGRGQCPDPLPEAFPMTAELMLARIETAVAQAVGDGLGSQSARMLRPLARGGRMALVSPIADLEPLYVLRLTVTEGAIAPWRIALAMPAAALTALLGDTADHSRSAAPAAVAAPADPLASPFGDLPLALTATLVDMAVPFSAIARLQPGDILPVAVARQVPLSVGGKVIGHGIVGDCDGSLALRLTRTFQTRTSQS